MDRSFLSLTVTWVPAGFTLTKAEPHSGKPARGRSLTHAAYAAQLTPSVERNTTYNDI
jgi:hypothetical protein